MMFIVNRNMVAKKSSGAFPAAEQRMCQATVIEKQEFKIAALKKCFVFMCGQSCNCQDGLPNQSGGGRCFVAAVSCVSAVKNF